MTRKSKRAEDVFNVIARIASANRGRVLGKDLDYDRGCEDGIRLMRAIDNIEINAWALLFGLNALRRGEISVERAKQELATSFESYAGNVSFVEQFYENRRKSGQNRRVMFRSGDDVNKVDALTYVIKNFSSAYGSLACWLYDNGHMGEQSQRDLARRQR